MSAKIIISYDGTENDHDALALGRMLGESGGSLVLAYVRHCQEQDPGREQIAQLEAEHLLDGGAEWLGDPHIERHVVMAGCTGDGLWRLAEREGADIVVFGSDAHTAPGSVSPGRSAERMLRGAPVAVAIAAARLRDRIDTHIQTVALAGGEVDPAARESAWALTYANDASSLAAPGDEGVDVLVVGSASCASEGTVGIRSATEYLIETARTSVLVVPRGRVLDFHGHTVALSA